MPSRPEILFPLFGQLTQFTGIGPKIAINLSKLNINSPRDLLFTLPHSLLIRNKIETVLDAINNDIIIIEIIVDEHLENQQKNRPYKINVSDAKVSFPVSFLPCKKKLVVGFIPYWRKGTYFR